MTCYRNGGCGPYEMYSCNVCPASKPEYLQREQPKPKTREVELFDFEAAAREAVQKAVDEIMPKLIACAKEDIRMFKDKIDTQPPFGSIGDSIDIEEHLKQHYSSSTSTTPVTTNIGPINTQYCGQRLPCGICRMTMMQCPMQVQKCEITCSSQTGTTGATVK